MKRTELWSILGLLVGILGLTFAYGERQRTILVELNLQVADLQKEVQSYYDLVKGVAEIEPTNELPAPSE